MEDNRTVPPSLKIPNAPTFGKLRVYLLLLGVGAFSAFLVPISLSLTFSGKIASDGPSNEIKAPSDSIIKSIAEENRRIAKGKPILSFDQPIMLAELNILRTRLKTLNVQLQSSTDECKRIQDTLDLNLENANRYFDLKRNAFKLEAISQLNLLSAQSDLDSIHREIAVHQKQCLQEQEKFRGEINIVSKEIDKQVSAKQLTEQVAAPSNGYLHRVSIKVGQPVSAGQLLAIFTSEGTAGANFTIPLRDRPFIKVGDIYLVTSEAYQILNNPPIRTCKITAISPDSFKSDQTNSMEIQSTNFQAQCKFEKSPLVGEYPFLVGMQVNGSAISVRATLVQILLQGYRRLVVSQEAKS